MKMKKFVRTINFNSPKIKLEKPKENRGLNKQLNLANEYQFDIDWWNKQWAIEWWSRNGHFNYALYRDYLLAKVNSENLNRQG